LFPTIYSVCQKFWTVAFLSVYVACTKRALLRYSSAYGIHFNVYNAGFIRLLQNFLLLVQFIFKCLHTTRKNSVYNFHMHFRERSHSVFNTEITSDVSKRLIFRYMLYTFFSFDQEFHFQIQLNSIPEIVEQ
jgi:hypothetical protein